MWRLFLLLGTMFLTAGCTVASQSSGPAAFTVNTSDDTAVNIDTPNENTAVFDIRNTTGIDKATVTLTGGDWPETIILRFHLNGLENLDFSYTDINIKIEISSHGDNEIRQSATQEGITEIIDTTNEFWMPVIISPTQGEATIPLEAGTIDVRVPPAFYERNPHSFTISWIDFYR